MRSRANLLRLVNGEGFQQFDDSTLLRKNVVVISTISIHLGLRQNMVVGKKYKHILSPNGDGFNGDLPWPDRIRKQSPKINKSKSIKKMLATNGYYVELQPPIDLSFQHILDTKKPFSPEEIFPASVAPWEKWMF